MSRSGRPRSRDGAATSCARQSPGASPAKRQARAGRTVDPHIPQLSIVPVDGRMEVELFVPARAIGFLQHGERARLLYDAFPFQRFGAYGGTVTSVAETMVLPTDIAEPVSLKEAAYKCGWHSTDNLWTPTVGSCRCNLT